jgi:hypothetical protein
MVAGEPESPSGGLSFGGRSARIVVVVVASSPVGPKKFQSLSF